MSVATRYTVENYVRCTPKFHSCIIIMKHQVWITITIRIVSDRAFTSSMSNDQLLDAVPVSMLVPSCGCRVDESGTGV